MKQKIEESKIFLKEVWRLLVNFFKPCGIKDPILEIPQDIRRMGQKIACLSSIMLVISMIFSFLLKLTNIMIEHRFIILGIFLFMLYRGREILSGGLRLYMGAEAEKYKLIFNDEVILRGSNIVGNVINKVFKYDKTQNLYKIMSGESIMNSIKNYLSEYWALEVNHIFDIIELISTLVMLIVAIITNTEIPQRIFIPIVLIVILTSFFTSAYRKINRKEFNEKDKKFNDEQESLKNDLLKIPSVVKNDLAVRIDKFKKSVNNSNENVKFHHQKQSSSFMFITLVETVCQYGIIVYYLLAVDYNDITLATIAEITATLVIIEKAIRNVVNFFNTLDSHDERRSIIEREEEDVKLILDAYYKEIQKASVQEEVKDIFIKPFSIKYVEESENDKPFTLTSSESIKIKNGEIAILSGVSGSGKSTFMKLLTERIKVEKSTEIPSTSRFLFYDENLRFGSLSIFEELFCSEESPDLEKMEEILKNLHLWPEIKANCVDVWQWMKEKKFENSLSNGQKQRLILAKMLYWMDDDIDVVVLDECTSGLDAKSEEDSADAEKILEYLVRYSNKDKKRIVIISTHQNISGFKQKLENEYVFKNFMFKKEGEQNVVREIST